MPGIVYIPCARPLADDVDRIRREVIRHDIGYLVVDSVALACDGPPEAAEVAVRFFGALRELGLGSLLIAHVNRSRRHGPAVRLGVLAQRRSADVVRQARGRRSAARPRSGCSARRPTPARSRRRWATGSTGANASPSREPTSATSRTSPRTSRSSSGCRPRWRPVRGRSRSIAAALDVVPDTVKKAVDRDQKSARPMFARVLGDGWRYRIGLSRMTGPLHHRPDQPISERDHRASATCWCQPTASRTRPQHRRAGLAAPRSAARHRGDNCPPCPPTDVPRDKGTGQRGSIPPSVPCPPS